LETGRLGVSLLERAASDRASWKRAAWVGPLETGRLGRAVGTGLPGSGQFELAALGRTSRDWIACSWASWRQAALERASSNRLLGSDQLEPDRLGLGQLETGRLG